MNPLPFSTHTAFGLPFLLAGPEEIITAVGSSQGKRGALAVVNAHVIALIHEDPNSPFAKALAKHDGAIAETAPVVKAIGKERCRRTYGPQLFHEVLTQYPNTKHFLLGWDEDILAKLRERYHIDKEMTLATENPDSEACLKAIETANPDIVWIGMGTPQQQIWAAKHRGKIPGILIGVGFAFAVCAGKHPNPPAWARATGTAWIWRMAREPKRLGPRYLKYHLLFLAAWLKACLHEPNSGKRKPNRNP